MQKTLHHQHPRQQQQQLQEQQQTVAAPTRQSNNTITTATTTIVRNQRDLERDILESALKGQEQQKRAQHELDRQGALLRESVDRAQLVAGQTDTVALAVDALVSEARASKLKRIWQCCLGACCDCCCCGCCSGARQERRSDDLSAALRLRRLAEKSPLVSNGNATQQADQEDSDNESLVPLNLVSLTGLQKRGQVASWKRTLAPPPGSRYVAGSSDIWYRQVDASLVQLQHDAEDMGQSLDEQIKLAQMLAVYLNYGVDQLIGANDKLVAEKGWEHDSNSQEVSSSGD